MQTFKQYLQKFFWIALLGVALGMVAAIINAPVSHGQTTEPSYTVPQCELPFEVDTSHYLGHGEAENGLTYIYYELAPNEVFVVVLVTEEVNNSYPLFYAFGDKKQPHVSYIDQKRDGTCDGVVKYWVNPRSQV